METNEDGYSKEVLYNVEWQVLRVSLLSQYNRRGGWSTHSGVKNNLERLEAYLTTTIEPYETALRTWRVLNCLNATVMSYGSYDVAKECRDEVIAVRDVLSEHHRKHVKDGYFDMSRSWNWDRVLIELKDLHKDNQYWFDAVYENLGKRVRKSLKSGTYEQYRSALRHFYDMMVEVRK